MEGTQLKFMNMLTLKDYLILVAFNTLQPLWNSMMGMKLANPWMFAEIAFLLFLPRTKKDLKIAVQSYHTRDTTFLIITDFQELIK